MIYELVLRQRVRDDIRASVTHYEQVGHDRTFIAALDVVLAAITTMPHRFRREP